LKKKTIITLLSLAAAIFGAGFVSGQKVQAEAPAAGSLGDPLVSQSYVRAQVEAKNLELQQKIKELQDKSTALESQLKALEAQIK
jgi:chaperonin cofactor prefoldin